MIYNFLFHFLFNNHNSATYILVYNNRVIINNYNNFHDMMLVKHEVATYSTTKLMGFANKNRPLPN